MFRESLLENYQPATCRRWATATSFALQIAAACVCVVLPLLYPEALPLLHANSSVLMTPPSGAPSRPSTPFTDRRPMTPADSDRDLAIHTPQHIPMRVDVTPDNFHPVGATGLYVPGAQPGDGANVSSPVLAQLIGAPTLHATVKPPIPSSLRVSPGVSQGLLITRIEPKYPELARISRIQGDVVLGATIGRNGRVENLHVVSGHPLLAQAALDAVKHWRYRPYMLGNEAVEVETQITVRFTLTN